MSEQFFNTSNTKLAVALATLGVPFYDPMNPGTSCKFEKEPGKWGVETNWRFRHKGTWTNFEGTEEAEVSAIDISVEYYHPDRKTGLCAGARRELQVIRMALDNRNELLNVVKAHQNPSSPDARKVSDIAILNAETLRKAIAEESLIKLRTRDKQTLVVPSRDAREHAERSAKIFGLKL